MGAEDYPYDPALEGCEANLQDLDKLRAIKDRRTAQWLYEIWHHIEANQEPIARKLKAEERRIDREHYEHLKALASSARRGVFGVEAKALWEEVTQGGADDSRGALEKLTQELRRGGHQRV